MTPAPPTPDDWRALVRERTPPLTLAREPEILDELAQHLADLYAEAIAAGATDADARAAATAALPAERDQLGRDLERAARTLPGLIADRWVLTPTPARPRHWSAFMSDFPRELLLAARALWRAPAYTTIMLATLALGIGANAAIFAAVDTILLRPLPFPNGDRLVVPVSIHPGRGIDGANVSFADYADWKQETSIFEAVALWRPVTADLNDAGEPERLRTAQVGPEFFRVMATGAVAGRTLLPTDHEPAAPLVTVLSFGLWQRVFGGADVIGRTVRIGGVTHEIVGVAPPRIVWPTDVELFTPMKTAIMPTDMLTRRDNMVFGAIALLRDPAALDAGNAFVTAIAARLERDLPASRSGWSNQLIPIREYIVDAGLRRALWVLLAAVAAVLAIGCANLAHLSLIRGLGRARETGVRMALGASRWRLVRQFAAECLLLAVAGGAAGAALATWTLQGLIAMAPAGAPFIENLTLDARVLAAGFALTLAAIVVAGLVPAIASAGIDPGTTLKDGSAAAGSSRRVRWLRHGLIVAEVAGAAALLVGAGLLLRSFTRIQQVDPGLDVDHAVMARISLPRTYSTDAQTADFFQRAIDRLAAVPGVEAAGATSYVPVGGGGIGIGRVFLAEGWPEPPAHPDVGAMWNVVSPDYFRAAGIPVLQGRSFTRDDRADATPVAIVSRSFAAQAFGDADPIGQRIRSWRDENTLREIVGVVGDVRYRSLRERSVGRQVYVPHAQNSWGLMNLVVRTHGDPDQLHAVVRREIRALDPQLAVSNIATLRAIARDSVAEDRYMTLLLTLLAATAVGLGGIGIYGVIGHAVSMRRRELGVRAALGASPRDLYGLVFRDGLRLTSAGLVLGLMAAAASGSMLEALLFQTEPRDPAAYGATIALIAVTALLACLGPARRAARVDPVTSLRT